MKKTRYFFLLYISGFLLFCTTSKKTYEQGNYYVSVLQAVEKLRKNPNHKKSKEVLAQSYPLAVKYLTGEIKKIESLNEDMKYSQLMDVYIKLNDLYDEIRRCPAALKVIPEPLEFYREMSAVKQNAAAEQYYEGEKLLKSGNRQDAKRAYQYFLKSNEYDPGFRDVEEKIREAKYVATLKVLVEQVHVPSVQYDISIRFFQDQIEQFLFNYNENPFVRFYAPNDPSLKNPDQILILQFDDFKVGQTNNFQKIYEVKKDSVIVGKTRLENGRTVNVYGTAKAKFIENKREVISEGLLSMKIIDAYSNTVVLHEKFPGRFVWSTMWGSYNGDEKALSKEQLRISEMKPVPPPPSQELFVQFCKPIYSQIVRKIKAYYRNI